MKATLEIFFSYISCYPLGDSFQYINVFTVNIFIGSFKDLQFDMKHVTSSHNKHFSVNTEHHRYRKIGSYVFVSL